MKQRRTATVYVMSYLLILGDVTEERLVIPNRMYLYSGSESEYRSDSPQPETPDVGSEAHTVYAVWVGKCYCYNIPSFNCLVGSYSSCRLGSGALPTAVCTLRSDCRFWDRLGVYLVGDS